MTLSPIPTNTDIVVAGGGPAGATIARLLADFGFQVVLLEKRRFPRHQIGESLTPSILPVLDFLRVRSRVEEAGFLRMVGHTVCWGSAQPRPSYYSADYTRRGFQVWRADFDSLLLDHARNGGVHVFEGQTVEGVDWNSKRVRVQYASRGHIAASFFVDACGHGSVLARYGFRRRESLFQTLALTGYWQGATGPRGIDFANTLLETYPNGLVWSVPLHNGLRNVTLLMDRQVGTQIRQVGSHQFYLSELQKVPYVCGFLGGAHLAGSLKAFDASWYTASTFANQRFLLVGDAGLFIDPLSSEGVHKALASAITGAVVINTILQRPAMAQHAISFYEEGQQATYTAHYRQSAQYYREEGRWPDHPFWQKRTQVQAEEEHPRASFSDSQPISHLRPAPGISIEQRAVIEGPYVELREVVVAPRYPRGVRFLQGVSIPPLFRLVEAQRAVAEVIPAYLSQPEGKNCPPESVRQVLARLYQEGILVQAQPGERS